MNLNLIPGPDLLLKGMWLLFLLVMAACGGSSAAVTETPIGDPYVVSRQAFQEAVSSWEMSGNPDLDAVSRSLEYAVRLDEQFYEAWFNLAVVYELMGENGEAIDAYNQAIRLDESGIAGRVNLATLYLSEGALNNAEELLAQAVEISEYDPHANLALARLHRERARSSVPYNNGEADQAINRIRRALQGDPNNPVAYELLSGVYFDLGRLELARLVCENAIEIGVDSAPLYNQLGLILLRMDDVTGAYAGFRLAVEMDPRLFEAAMNQGAIALNYRDYRAALESFDLVLAVRPSWDEALISRGVALRGLEDYEGATQSYLQALEVNPENGSSMYNLGILYQEYTREYETAISWFERYMETDGASDSSRHDEVSERISALQELLAYLQGLTPQTQQPEAEESDDGGGTINE